MRLFVYVVRLCVFMRQDELSFETRLEVHTTKDSSSRRIIRLAPVFLLETDEQMFAQV